MSKTILSELDGFTPVIDCLAREHGLVTAAVYGRIWRYCQMKDGVCQASLETLSQDIGLNKATIMRHAQKLVEAGYLEDTTPDLRNHPHTYRDTGKLTITSKISVAQCNTSNASVADSNASVADSNASVAESQLKKDLKKPFKRDIAPATPRLTDFQNSQQAFITTFCQLTGVPEPPHKSKSFGVLWGSPSAEVVKALNGESLEYLTLAVTRLRAGKMTISTPKSVVGTIMAIYGERRTPPAESDERLVYV